MSVRMRKNGTWVCEYYYVDQEGKRRKTKKSFGKGESGKLAAKAKDIEMKADKVKIPKFNGPKFSDIAIEYQKAKFLMAGAMSESDKQNTYYKFGAHILPYFGDHYVMNFNSALLDSYVVMRMTKVKATTVHRELSIVRAVINWGTEQTPPLIPYNPVLKYKLPKRDDAIILPPTEHERALIYKNAAPHVKRFLILNYNTGARSGSTELLQICWEHVDTIASMIAIMSSDKGGPKLRRVPISEELEGFLEVWRKEDSENQNCDPLLVSGPIVHYRGKPIKKINKAWKATLERAAIKRRIRPYDLRHAFATELLEAGGDLGTVSKIMGHSRPDTTLKVYQHITTKQEKTELGKLPKSIKKEPGAN